MKKWIASLIIVSSGFIAFLQAKADTFTDSSVYCEGDDAERVYEIATTESDFAEFFSTEGLSISKNRIMPLYSFNLLDYAWDDTLVIALDKCNNHAEEEVTSGNVYVARVDLEDHSYAGYVKFCIEEGHAYMHYFTPSVHYEEVKNRDTGVWEDEYVDYMDNEELFNQLFRDTEEINPNNVRLVSETKMGIGFFVSFEKREDVFIHCKEVVMEKTLPAKYYLADDELKNIARNELDSFLDMREKYIQRYSAWEKEHPGEVKYLLGFGPYPVHYLDEKINENSRVVSENKNISDRIEWDYSEQSQDITIVGSLEHDSEHIFVDDTLAVGEIAEGDNYSSDDRVHLLRNDLSNPKREKNSIFVMISVSIGIVLILTTGLFICIVKNKKVF